MLQFHWIVCDPTSFLIFFHLFFQQSASCHLLVGPCLSRYCHVIDQIEFYFQSSFTYTFFDWTLIRTIQDALESSFRALQDKHFETQKSSVQQLEFIIIKIFSFTMTSYPATHMTKTYSSPFVITKEVEEESFSSPLIT